MLQYSVESFGNRKPVDLVNNDVQYASVLAPDILTSLKLVINGSNLKYQDND